MIVKRVNIYRKLGSGELELIHRNMTLKESTQWIQNLATTRGPEAIKEYVLRDVELSNSSIVTDAVGRGVGAGVGIFSAWLSLLVLAVILSAVIGVIAAIVK